MTTAHLSWRYRRRRNRQEDREFREAQRRRAERRWEQERASRPKRGADRVVVVTIRDSAASETTTLRLTAGDYGHRWGRWRVEVDGQRLGRQLFAGAGLGRILARYLGA